MLENSHLTPEQFVPDLDTSAVWTVRYIDPSGFEVQLSIEAPTGTEAMRKGQLVIDRLKETQCSPIIRKPAIATSMANEKDDVHVCQIHGTSMKRWEKNGKVWFAHKFDDHWCRGKG